MKIKDNTLSIIGRFESILLWYFAIMICVYNNCFLKWNSYNHATISLIFKLMYHTVCILMLIYAIFIRHQRKKLNFAGMISILIAIILYIHANLMGGEYILLNMIPMFETIIVVLALFLMDDSRKELLLNRLIIVFCILVLPSMVYYILYSAGIKIPYSILASDNPGKVLRSITYMHYPFGLIIKAPWSIARFTGVFDEPGVVGTMAAILIAIGYRRCDKKWIILLVIEGMLSLSMAFYVLLVIFLVARAYVDGAFKAAGTIGLIIILLVVFVNIPVENESLRNIQSRINLSSSSLVEDNRTSSSFDTEFESFLQKGGYDLLMGKGGMGAYEKNPKMFGSNSYKCLVYDLGIIGFILYMLFFAFILGTRKWDKEYLPFIVVFIASVYQRAYVFNVQMVSIYLIGIVYISLVSPRRKVLFTYNFGSQIYTFGNCDISE